VKSTHSTSLDPGEPPSCPPRIPSVSPVLKATPEKVYRAFLDADPEQMVSPNGSCKSITRSQVGGTYKMSFTKFHDRKAHSFGGTYLELVPGERLRLHGQVRRSEPAREIK